ncbi:unnamed protein product [Chondrus crispus]|uniref:Uncharacterized protein n=1 Tax=Chondrus crispus TaxID=2769 RepID=R7QNW5_CHOCR|nr:unnamed protein product [Chondrus crispus]CDF39065.1 unnamed protein product [Chondrus crispus]|eukprot:XP_005718976.1 unnamed protein product [Chondrus crispus]
MKTDNVSGITREQRSQKFMEQMQLKHDERMLTEGAAAAWKAMEVALQSSSRSGTEVIGDIDSGWFGEERRWRSSRTLQKLCVLMIKLIMIAPPSSLFKCETCEGDEGRLHAVCADGIWSGYQRKWRRTFVNVSETCQALKPSKASSHSMKAIKRPLIGLLRKEQTGMFLIDAIKGDAVTVTNRTLPAVVGAIRLISPHLLPVNYLDESLTGRSPNDKDDIGISVASRLRDLICCCFSQRELCERLCRALLLYLKKRQRGTHPSRKRRKSSRNDDLGRTGTASLQSGHSSNVVATDSEVMTAIIGFLASHNGLEANNETDREGKCWSKAFMNSSLGSGLWGRERICFFSSDISFSHLARRWLHGSNWQACVS